MSYDITIYDNDTGQGQDFNITYNVAPMFRAVFPDDGIRIVYGKTGLESQELLLKLHNYLIVNREDMIALEPSNKWGTWYDTVKFVNRMCMYAAILPNGVWEGD